MRLLTRRVFVGVLAAAALVRPGWFGSDRGRNDEELIVVNGWILKTSDLGAWFDDR